METPLLLATLLSVATGVMYGYVGWRLSRRRVEGPSRLASSLFATWWFALAGMTLAGAVVRTGAVLGVVDLPMYLTWTYLALLLICAALWALVYYLVYLLLGTRRALVPLTVFYVLLYVWFVYLVSASRPDAILVERWSVKLHYGVPITGAPVGLSLAALLGPPLLAAAGYFRLFFRVEDRTQRYRIGLVSVTLGAWFLSAVIAALSEVNEVAWWPVVSGFIGLLAAVFIYLAYQPPRWVRERYGVAATDEAAG